MNGADGGVNRRIPEPFDKTLLLIRNSLASAGFSIVAKIDVSSALQTGSSDCCVVLLVDTPILLFEAIVLDRAPAAFLPLHVVVCGDRTASEVYCANPMVTSGLRPPEPAKGALEALYRHLSDALAGLPYTMEVCPD